MLWGAFVRATGSGAGCGRHWPLCNGEVLPRSARAETLIELTHRATSGLALLAVAALFVWAWKRYPRTHPVTIAAGLSLFFIVVEALIGAGLVLLEMVAGNDSMARAYWMIAHLVNTFVLLAVLALTAWWASGAPAGHLRGDTTERLLLAGLLLTVLVGATGAVAALGDTLFPARSLAEGIRDSFSADAHVLVRLRKLHPLLAVLTGAYLVAAAHRVQRARPGPVTRALAATVAGLYLVQLVAGAVNVVLLAPVWLQLVHLLLADLLWIALVLLAAAATAVPPSRAPARPSPGAATLAG